MPHLKSNVRYVATTLTFWRWRTLGYMLLLLVLLQANLRTQRSAHASSADTLPTATPVLSIVATAGTSAEPAPATAVVQRRIYLPLILTTMIASAPSTSPTLQPVHLPAPQPASPTPIVAGSDFAERLLILTNQHRRQFGCPALTLNPRLAMAAQRHSDDMARHDFIGHTGVDGSTSAERIQQAGYQYWEWAENLAAGYQTPESVIAAWMQSADHRDNMLNCHLRDIGIGYTYRANTTYMHYWSQTMARPQ